MSVSKENFCFLQRVKHVSLNITRVLITWCLPKLYSIQVAASRKGFGVLPQWNDWGFVILPFQHLQCLGIRRSARIPTKMQANDAMLGRGHFLRVKINVDSKCSWITCHLAGCQPQPPSSFVKPEKPPRSRSRYINKGKVRLQGTATPWQTFRGKHLLLAAIWVNNHNHTAEMGF